jgi:2'-5' RNA ligase
MPLTRRKIDPRQLSLDFDGSATTAGSPEASSRDTMFFATLPEASTARRMVNFAATQRRRLGLSGKLRRRETLHITLLGLGAYDAFPPETIERVKRAASAVRLPHFRVGLDRMMSFESRKAHPLVLSGEDGVLGLGALHAALGTALAGEGFKLTGLSDYKPHATLLYDRKPVAETLLDEPFGWIVKNFVLIHSHYGESRYDQLGNWPLLGPGAAA